MSVGDALKRAAQAGRRAAVSAGQRPTSVVIVVETLSASQNVTGATVTDTALTVLDPAPKVAPAGDGDFSWFGGGHGTEAGGVARAGLYRVGPITPSHPGGGYTEAQLAPDAAAAIRVRVLLAGGDFPAAGEKCRVIAIHRETEQSLFLLVQRTQQ